MINEGWQGLFSDKILERGYDYWASGMVSEVYSTEEGYEATVRGTYDYEVEIILEDDEVAEMYCDCPYAEGGSNCKHMAAVLYEITDYSRKSGDNESGKTADIPDTERRQQEVAASVDSISEADLREYVKGLLYKDRNLYAEFKIQYHFSDSREMMDIFKGRINRIFEEQSGEYGYIDYYQGTKLEKQLYSTMEELTDKLKLRGSYQEIFELSLFLFKKLEYVDIDNSNGVLSGIMDYCTDTWETLLDECDEQSLKKMMFSSLLDTLKYNGMGYREETAWGFLFDFCEEKEILSEMMNMAEEKIRKCKMPTDSWNYSGNMNRYVLEKIYLMEKMGCSDKDIMEFSRHHWDIDQVRSLWICKYEKAGDQEQAIRLLKESMEQAEDKPGLVLDYRRMLMQIYRQMGNEAEYRAELAQIILNDPWALEEEYNEYKAMFNKTEWKQELEKVLASPYGKKHLYELLEKEKLYGRLMEEIKELKSLSVLRRFEKILQKEYGDEILQIYVENVEEMAGQKGGRSMYKELAQILTHMKEFSNGTETVEQIVKSWRNKYRNRRAMMDELKNF